MQSVRVRLCCHLWLVWLHHIFRRYLTNGTIFEEKAIQHKMYVLSLQILSKTFLIQRRIWRDIVINVKTSSCKVPVIFVGFSRKLNYLDRFSKKSQILNFINIRPVGAELFYADRGKDGHEADSRFSQFCVKRLKC